ncbi:Synaptobrevin [Eumeta japonica]|uniref:Synaptobrevin n=1 Tax=Eumeta variegata TaxID=151549 RepID=A0A4C1TQ77_EUMVA|nr:Synaptobrevin [Eumeta japonica]
MILTSFASSFVGLARATEGGSGPPAPAEPQTGPDGEIIGGPRNMQQIAAQKRLQQTHAQVDEVKGIMETNVIKVLERDQKLSELDERADELQYGASLFEQQAKSLKKKFWLKNLKMMIIMGVILVVIVGLLFVRYRGTATEPEHQTEKAEETPPNPTALAPNNCEYAPLDPPSPT